MIHRLRSPVLVVLFFLSGFLGLVYEVVWIRKLSLVFGSTSIALSTVLGMFFGGLALGSFLFGRVAGRSRNPVRLYAWLEVGIGLWAFVLPGLIRLVDGWYGTVQAVVRTDFVLLTLLRILMVAPVIVVPTTLMGGTLPILVRHFVRDRAHLSTRVGALYAVNTLGGAAGAFVCGFYLIRFLGVDPTNYQAAAVNVAVGVAAWWLGRRAVTEPGTATEAGSPQEAPASADDSPFDRRIVGLAIVGFGISGLTGLAYEVVWARYLSLFLVSSIYAYTTILVVFLVGLVAGAFLFARFLERRRNLIEIFGYVQVALGVSALILLPALVRSQPLVTQRTDNLFLLQFVLCALLMIVPTTLMGSTLPLVTKIVTRRIGRVGRTVGNLYAINTFGAIAGSVLAGFLLLPRLGIGGSNGLLAALNLTLGAAAILVAPGVQRLRGLAVGAGILALGLAGHAALRAPVPEARLRQLVGGAERIVTVDEGLVNTVWISEDPLGRRSLWTNNSIMGRTVRPYRHDLSAQRVQGHIPMLLHPGDPRRVLGIAFGTGQTFGAQLFYPIERIDIVDISPTVVEVSLKHFADVQNGLGSDPRVNVIIDDGRDFVDRTTNTYDVISLEMPPHEEVGIVHFYTREFYRAARSRLRPDGILAQWVPIYNVTPSETLSVTRTFLEVFPEAIMWHNASDILLLGCNGDFRIDLDRLAKRLSDEAIARDLSVSYVGDPARTLDRPGFFLASFLMGPRELAGFARQGSLYTDDRPDLEFTWTDFEIWGPERRDLLVLENTEAISKHLGDPRPFLRGDPAAVDVDRLPEIRRSYLDRMRAVAYDNLGNHFATHAPQRALEFYRTANRLQPGYAEPYNNLGTLLLDGDRVPQAIRMYREAIRLDPRYAQAWYNLGLAFDRQEMNGEALDAFAEADRIRGGFAKARFAAANLHARSGSPRQAEQAYRAAIEADPEFSDAYLALAVMLADAGDTSGALEVVDGLLARVPDDRRGRDLRKRLRSPAR